MPITDLLNGATIAWGQSGVNAEILSVNWSGIHRNAVDASHAGTTGGKPFLYSGMYDPGELSVDVNLDSDFALPGAITATAETITITVNDGTNSTNSWAATGAMTDFEWSGEQDGKMVGSLTIKYSGDITIV